MSTKISILAVMAMAPGCWGQGAALAPLSVEWPSWLTVPGADLISKRDIRPGTKGVSTGQFCAGDSMEGPSKGCAYREYHSAAPVENYHGHFAALLAQYGYTTQNARTYAYANLELANQLKPGFGWLKMRQYPNPQLDTYYNQIEIGISRIPTAPPYTQITINVSASNGPVQQTSSAAAAAPAVREADKAVRKAFSELPQPYPKDKNSWQWVVQSVQQQLNGKTIFKYLYQTPGPDYATVDTQYLPLPAGGAIVHVFPDNVGFLLQDDKGNKRTFNNPMEAVGQTVGPGNWMVFPLKRTGIDVFFSDRAAVAKVNASPATVVRAAAAVAPSAPAAPSQIADADVAQIQPGMKSSDVQRLLGKPYSQIQSDKLSWTYLLQSGKRAKIEIGAAGVSEVRVSK